MVGSTIPTAPNPRNYNTAPDLTPTAIQFASSDATCGQLSSKLDINVQLENIGNLIVGPSLIVAFEGIWSNPDSVERLLDANGDDLIYQIQAPLEPADATIISVHYDVGNNNQDRLPDQIRAIVDANQRERECVEDNNSILGDVQPGEQASDLRVELGESSMNDCPECKGTGYRLQRWVEASIRHPSAVFRWQSQSRRGCVAGKDAPGPIGSL